MAEPLTRVFEPDAGIPNSRLPLVFWRERLPHDRREGSQACALFERNGWQGTWVYTVYPFWHFHSQGHEVLACVSGSAVLGLGGDRGLTLEVAPGDVCVIPAGVGHRRLDASQDFAMAGGYPPGQQGDIVRPGELAADEIARRIALLALPATDPVSGMADGVVAAWAGVRTSA